MKNLLQLLLVLLTFSMVACGYEETTTVGDVEQVTEQLSTDLDEPSYTTDEEMQNLFDSEISDEQVMIKGEVIKTLADDNEGSRHQKFIVKIASGQTILVSHNIDLANKIDDLTEGDQVKIYGQYEWNDRGGVIHWTHHDPDGEHVGGWIEHQSTFYD
ncbi:MAG: DUF3465 domain-containing protein [Crocinitomix sp.]|nr:DUF3465 domain-containing protein [Crocinitomix sp.]